MHIEEVMQTYGDYLTRVAYLYMKDEMLAEDIVQDVFIKFYQSAQFEGRASLKTYLVRMTINRCYDELRKQQRKKESFFAKIFRRTDQTPESMAVAKTEMGEVTTALLQLPLAQREAIIFYYYEEMTSVEIAELLDISESTVRMRLKRAREALRKVLIDMEWGDEV